MSYSGWDRIVALELEEKWRIARENQRVREAKVTEPGLLDHLGWRMGAVMIGLGEGVQRLVDKRALESLDS